MLSGAAYPHPLQCLVRFCYLVLEQIPQILQAISCNLCDSIHIVISRASGLRHGRLPAVVFKRFVGSFCFRFKEIE